MENKLEEIRKIAAKDFFSISKENNTMMSDMGEDEAHIEVDYFYNEQEKYLYMSLFYTTYLPEGSVNMEDTIFVYNFVENTGILSFNFTSFTKKEIESKLIDISNTLKAA